MPDVDMWTFAPFKLDGRPIRQIGINLGAPGDRRADDGTFWLEYPVVGGPSPKIDIRTSPTKPRWFRHHASRFAGPGLPWVAASGAIGLRSINIRLARPDAPERTYAVRLHFAEPDDLQPGQRVFDVALQGRNVLTRLDIIKQAGGRNRAVVRECTQVVVKDVLTIALEPSPGSHPPLLCGIQAKIEN